MSTTAAVSDPTDEQLMQSLADGDAEALRILHSRYRRLVYAQAHKICASESLAQDTVQEVFLALWRYPARFDPSRRFSTWLLAVAHHKAVDAVRRETTARRRAVPVTDADIEYYFPPEPGADQAALRSMTGDHVRLALSSLPTDQRKAITLLYYGGLTQREVATITGVPLGTVKSRMFAGTQHLRRLLAPLRPALTSAPP